MRTADTTVAAKAKAEVERRFAHSRKALGQSAPKEPAEPQDFNELVSWATWILIVAITKGQPLNRAVHQVLSYARQWAPATKEQP